MTDMFRTIATPSRGRYREKGSKFIAFAYPVDNEVAIRDLLTSLRKTYHDARHHCYAWRTGAAMKNYRLNDDREPSGSAGKPIFGQIQSRGLTNILIVVIRYFGGTLLGVGGLINAYRTAAADALNNAQIIDQKVFDHIKLKFDYSRMNAVMKVIKEFELETEDQQFDQECILTLKVWKRNMERVSEKIARIEGCKLDFPE